MLNISWGTRREWNMLLSFFLRNHVILLLYHYYFWIWFGLDSIITPYCFLLVVIPLFIDMDVSKILLFTNFSNCSFNTLLCQIHLFTLLDQLWFFAFSCLLQPTVVKDLLIICWCLIWGIATEQLTACPVREKICHLLFIS